MDFRIGDLVRLDPTHEEQLLKSGIMGRAVRGIVPGKTYTISGLIEFQGRPAVNLVGVLTELGNPIGLGIEHISPA